MMNKTKRLIILAGGTGGHIFSGLAVAQYLMKQGWQICWLGATDRIEANLIPRYGIKIKFICISGLRGKGIKALLCAPMRIFNAWHQACIVIRSFKPDVALGMGGYVSGPSGLAAWFLGVPVILHEQNGIAGLTNKLLTKIASKVMQSRPGVLPQAKVVGNPIRLEILSIPRPEVRFINREGPMRILVIGGSQGAYIFNKLMPEVAAKLGKTVTIWHQIGHDKNILQSVVQAYTHIGQTSYKVTEFIDDIAKAYEWADVVICRAGALTVSEIAVVGIPALFVPFQHKDRHQYLNAKPLEKIGAAKILDQSQFTVDAVVTILISWKKRTTLLKMAQLARIIAMPNATKQVAEEISLMVNS